MLIWLGAMAPLQTVGTPFAGAFDAFPGIVAVAAFIALWKYKADIMLVIGVCALLGPAYLFFM